MTVTDIDTLFKPTSASVRQLLSDLVGGFSIPSYQRPYRWNPTDIRRLCEDLIAGLDRLSQDEQAVAFFGAIITVSGVSDHHHTKPADARQVIDGQQRLSTIVMIAIGAHESLGRLTMEVATDKNLDDEVREWIQEQISEARGQLMACLSDSKSYGDQGFRALPKITREIADCWSNKQAYARYQSPISHLIHTYLTWDADELFRPSVPSVHTEPAATGSSRADHELLHRRFNYIRKLLREVSGGRANELAEAESLNHLLRPASSTLKGLFQNCDPALTPLLRDMSATNEPLGRTLRLLLFSRFLLEKVAITQINARDESYAFDLFDSLNTTGEPLTALETFVPLVVEAEGVLDYASSQSYEHISLTTRLISAEEGAIQRQTERLVTSFLLADSGSKVPNKHNEQRRELTRRYRSAENIDQRRRMTRQLADSSLAYFHLWQRLELSRGATGIEGSLSQESMFCLRFLSHINHTIVLAPLSRYYSVWVERGDSASKASLESVIKASTAFSVLWRAAHGGTDGIDSEYRRLVASGVTDVCGPLARTGEYDHDVRDLPDVEHLIAAYRGLLKQPGQFSFVKKAEWINLAAQRPIYDEQAQLSRFLLLVAAHHAVPDGTTGLTKDGSVADHTNMLLADRYTTDDRLATVEHVAPVQPAAGTWGRTLYNSPEVVDLLGNLTLLPLDDNSFISNRPWPQKKLLYRALSSGSPDEAGRVLSGCRDVGLDLNEEKVQYVIERREHLPVLQALARFEGEWDETFVRMRTEHLMGRVWDVLDRWLPVDE